MLIPALSNGLAQSSPNSSLPWSLIGAADSSPLPSAPKASFLPLGKLEQAHTGAVLCRSIHTQSMSWPRPPALSSLAHWV